MKIAYVHNLPLEYYPPATNLLNCLAGQAEVSVRAYSTENLKQRAEFRSPGIKIIRGRLPGRDAPAILRLFASLWWHVRTAIAVWRFRPDVIFYVEPHSAITVWLLVVVLRRRCRLFIHHHEYYAKQDCKRPGMRLPAIGYWLERRCLFGKAEWVSQTNPDRLSLLSSQCPAVAASVWQVLPNYPPQTWLQHVGAEQAVHPASRQRLIYVGSASFEDTYIREIVLWAAANKEWVNLHICGYNVAQDVWTWLADKQFPNVSCAPDGCAYADLPGLLSEFDVGLVLYKGNTSNFVFNIPNKVFEYLVCGLEVWFPREMKSTVNLLDQTRGRLRQLDFHTIMEKRPSELRTLHKCSPDLSQYTAERAFAPLVNRLLSARA